MRADGGERVCGHGQGGRAPQAAGLREASAADAWIAGPASRPGRKCSSPGHAPARPLLRQHQHRTRHPNRQLKTRLADPDTNG